MVQHFNYRFYFDLQRYCLICLLDILLLPVPIVKPGALAEINQTKRMLTYPKCVFLMCISMAEHVLVL